jgi:glycosyltransferase involved in cell wall biosynthesis
MKKISIITPCFNEEAGIAECAIAIQNLFSTELSAYDYEHIFIDNNSTDLTVDVLRELATRDQRVKVIINSRNFGGHRSPYHAFLQASGDAVIPIVADLQTPVELIPLMITKWESGYDLVFAVRRSTKISFIQRVFQKTYYRLLKLIGANEHISQFIGFGLFDKKIVRILASFEDTVPYMRGSLSEVGFNKSIIEYDEPARKHGKSRQGFLDRFEYASLGITVSSSRPIYFVILLGLLTAAISLAVSLIYAVIKIAYWERIDLGVAPLLILTSFIGAVQLISVGIIGLYAEVILRHVRARPLVIERERINFDN